MERKASWEHTSRCMRLLKKNKKNPWSDRSVTLSLHRLNFRIFLGWNNANLFTETIAVPPRERWLSCHSHHRRPKPKQAQHQLVFRGFTFYIGFYVKLLTAFYNRDAPFKYLHDTTFWGERRGPGETFTSILKLNSVITLCLSWHRIFGVRFMAANWSKLCRGASRVANKLLCAAGNRAATVLLHNSTSHSPPPLKLQARCEFPLGSPCQLAFSTPPAPTITTTTTTYSSPSHPPPPPPSRSDRRC